MQKLTDNVYVETGFQGSNNSFVVTSEGIVMIDTPQMPANAIKWRDEIARHGQVRYIINTEPHGDHFTGNCFFEGTVVGHEGTREAILASSVEQLKEMTRRMDPDSLSLLEGFAYRPPTITLSQRLTLHLGKHTFKLINLPGHSLYQVAVYVPEERVVFTSDNVVYKTQPFLRQALPYKWLASLKQYQKFDADYLVPGHGEVCDRSYLPEMASSIQAWIDAATEAIDRGMSLEEAQKDTALLERHSIKLPPGPMTGMMAGGNFARLYELLKK